ncbi:MAG: dihydroorotase [Desulfobulbaceae bacterium]|nr:MAG: dihydroorotase [Desulfobulbaceae bacterium]
MGAITILQGGRLVDPVLGIDTIEDLWIQNDRIIKSESATPKQARVYDVSGCLVMPGFIDMHVHLREPGQEYKETIQSGTRAAAAGGFTGVACMPNTNPVNDCGAVSRFIAEAARDGFAKVYPVGAISKGLRGIELAEYAEMKAEGVVALTDDGMPVVDSQLMRRAMEYASSFGLKIISHAEDPALSFNGTMNEGYVSTRLGLKGIPTISESIMVYREIALAEFVGVPVHIAHVSTRPAVELIRAAKSRGVKVTAETAPHYFTLTDEAVEGYDTHAKMNPPLRSEEDLLAIRGALSDGTIDVIATDHAPHSELEKDIEYDLAANGIIGLETAVPLGFEMVRQGVIDVKRLVELFSSNPAEILGVHTGSLQEGGLADITVVDPEKEFVYAEEAIVSKSVNSPFVDWNLKGKPVLTICEGAVTHDHSGSVE